MRPITFIRAVALVGVVVAGWSMTLRWGDIGKGPPAQWERQVVGAVVLSVVCALCLAFMGMPGTRRSWIARGVAAAASAGAVLIAIVLRQDAVGSGFPQLLAGAGWTWLLAGCGLGLAAAVAALSVKSEVGDAKKRDAKKKKR